MQKAYFIPYQVNSGFVNMQVDEKLLDYVINNLLTTPIFRLYGWKPACISLGRNQKMIEINESFCKENNIDIVRRATGGRALLHDNEVTYSFICPIGFLNNGETVISSYKEISSSLALGLSKLGIDIDFPSEKKVSIRPKYCMSLATGADLSFHGKKLIGSAQYRKQGYVLQHGSVLIDYNKDLIKNIFSEEPESSHITTINEIDASISRSSLCSALKKGIEEYFNLSLKELHDIRS